MTRSIKLFSLLLIAGLFVTSCSDDDDTCDITCPVGSVLSADCNCVSTDPCAGIECPVGQVLTVDCDCVDSGATQTEVISGAVTSNTTWTSDKVYELASKVVVEDGATLTIQPGTIIKGRKGQGSLATALVVARGGKLNACGTASAPIIFTSEEDNIDVGEIVGTNLDETQIGLWGGLIVLGKAPCSLEGDVNELQIEGIPADDEFGLYGGNDPNDNSGTLCYISVRHGGALIGEGNEINGITLAGVGSGTSISNIEVVGNFDDGIEWFGGTVNVNNALVWAQGDDAFDIDQAWSGTLDNFVYIAGPESDHGMEVDGPEGSLTGRFTLTNGTMRGLNAEYADFRDGAMGTITNTYWFGFDGSEDNELELDDDATSANYFGGMLELTGMEFNTTLTCDKLFDDKAPSGDDASFETQMCNDNSIVTTQGSVGADTSVFGWTMAAAKGALNF